MNSKSETTIDFSKLGGPVYIGRARGRKARDVLGLEKLDKDSDLIDVKIPDDTYALNSSYFLGLFGPSIRFAGSASEFKKKYRFYGPDHLMETIDDYVVRSLQENRSLL